MKWTPSPAALVHTFDEAVQSLRGTERRKMFGYPAIFVNGNMFAGLIRDRMVLRLDDKARDQFLGLPGAKPFIAMGRRMRQWVIVPAVMTKSEPELKRWLGKALAHGRSLPAKPARRPRGRT